MGGEDIPLRPKRFSSEDVLRPGSPPTARPHSSPQNTERRRASSPQTLPRWGVSGPDATSTPSPRPLNAGRGGSNAVVIAEASGIWGGSVPVSRFSEQRPVVLGKKVVS